MKSGSNLEKVLEAGHFAVTAEIGPPQNADAEEVKEKAHILKGYIDACNVTDGQTAVVRMSSTAGAMLGKEMGLDSVVQMTCRDRNRIALQMDILGMAALGLNNIVCLTGDYVSFGDHPQAKSVHDIDSVQLLELVKDMRDNAILQNGEEIKGVVPRLYIGAAVNPFADPLEYRVNRLAKKIAAGADFVQTQLVYNLPKFEKWMEMVRERGLHKKVKILAGVTPIKSIGAAKYMKTRVPGLDVPDEVIERFQNTPKEERAQEGINLAVETIKKLKDIEGIAGVHIMAIEWEEAVPQIVEKAGLSPRPSLN
ncbi:methylenetetrahydrofolate reductase [Chloroflexota bacterium]